MEHFLKRLHIYNKIPLTVNITEIAVKILVELLSTLALATKQIKEGKPSASVFDEVLYYLNRRNAEKFFKKLFGEKDTEAVLQRLDRLTQDEARITAAETLKVVHGLIQNMEVVMISKQIDQACRPLGVEAFSPRRQGIGRSSKRYPRYVCGPQSLTSCELCLNEQKNCCSNSRVL